MSNKITNGICQATIFDLLYVSATFGNLTMDTVREIHTALKNNYALWCHKYDIFILFKAKFLKKEAK